MKDTLKIGVCQMNVVDDKTANINKAVEMIGKAAENGSELVVLPEMFNCPYDTSKFQSYSEESDSSESLKAVSSTAKEYGVYLVAGSIPEKYDGKICNSSFIFKDGLVLDVHRKLHLFDVDIPGKIFFKESEIVKAGNKITVVDTPVVKMGVAICYDMRFPELFRIMTLEGSEIVVVPGAFNTTTGPAHWETTIRARAIDNQIYMVAASPARNEDLSYTAYGHSMVVDPWGKIIAEAGEGEEIIYADIKLSILQEVRDSLPLLKNRRRDIYNLKWMK